MTSHECVQFRRYVSLPLSHLHLHPNTGMAALSRAHACCLSHSASLSRLLWGQGSSLNGGAGSARGKSSKASRLAGLKCLRKPSKACFAQSEPSGSFPSETNYNYRWVQEERLDQRKQCTRTQSLHLHGEVWACGHKMMDVVQEHVCSRDTCTAIAHHLFLIQTCKK